MATARLPDDPSFEQLRRQAKDLRDFSRAGLQGALDLVGAHHPDGPHAVSLAGAQFVVARHYGFASWAALRRHVTTIEHYRRAPDEVDVAGTGQLADEFLILAVLRYGDDSPTRWQRAARLLSEHPEITRTSVHAAAAAADADPPAKLIRGQLQWAVTHDMRDRVRLLAEHGADLLTPFEAQEDRIVQCVNACDGRTPAEAAAVCGCWAVLDWLLEHGGAPRPAADGVDGLIAAALAGDRRTADLLRGHADAARKERPGLIVWAAARRAWQAIPLLTELGWDVNARARVDVPVEQQWETALHEAAGAGEIDAARMLLELGADPDARDARFNATPLGWAEHFGQQAMADYLGPLTRPEST